MHKNKFLIFLFVFFVSFAVTESHAEGTITVNEIRVSGNQRIEVPTIKAFLNVPMGRPIAKSSLDESFRKTFNTGLFKDLNLRYKSGVLHVQVEENPIISEVEIVGNDKIDDEAIKLELQVQPRSVYKKSDVQADIKRILTLYQRSGRFNVKVDTQIKDIENNRVEVVYVIDEGKRAKVSQISFVNNFAYDEAELESVISTKESRWYRFFSGNDNYDPDRLEYDKELLRRHYVANGFADFKINSADAEFNRAKGSFNMIFTVDEGPYYQFGKIDLDSEIEEINFDLVEDKIITRSDEEFNAEEIESTISELTDFLGDKGYAFVQINPQYNRREEEGKLDVTYKISEGPRVYINRINIKGNTRTTDEVIRREFRISEGDPFNTTKLKRSKQRVEGLGFFSKVDIDNEQTANRDKVDINVVVEEQSTGELTFGAGFSSADGALGDIGITERNLLGQGQYLKANFTLAAARQEIDLSFTEPYFLGRNFAAGIDLFNIKTDSSSSISNLTFDSDTIGGTIRGAYPISEYVKHSLRYTLRNDDISNPDPSASLYVRQQVGERTTSSIGHTFAYNTLDNQFLPKSGIFASIAQDFAGIGGDVDYIKHEGKFSYFTLVDRDWPDVVMRLSAKAGNINGMGEDVRINDRFFIGNSTIRGFDNQGVGARDQTTGDPLGNNTYYATSAEVMFPLGLPEELQIKGAAFADAGSAFNLNQRAAGGLVIQDDESVRSSAGVGLFWRSPVGPVRIDIATPLSKESYDRDEFFQFSFGTKF